MSEKINATVEIEVPLAAFSGLLHSMVSTMAISILTSKQFPRPTVYTALKIKQTLLLYKFGRKYKLGRFFGSPGRKLNISSVESWYWTFLHLQPSAQGMFVWAPIRSGSQRPLRFGGKIYFWTRLLCLQINEQFSGHNKYRGGHKKLWETAPEWLHVDVLDYGRFCSPVRNVAEFLLLICNL